MDSGTARVTTEFINKKCFGNDSGLQYFSFKQANRKITSACKLDILS